MAFRIVATEPPWEKIIGDRCRVYKNLQSGLMTIQHKSNGTWRVCGASSFALLQDVKFKIAPNKLRWVKENQRRTVCAWAEGTLISRSDPAIATPLYVRYNPLLMTPNGFYIHSPTGDVVIEGCRHFAVLSNHPYCSPEVLGGRP